jgi:hypothetical protein
LNEPSGMCGAGKAGKTPLTGGFLTQGGLAKAEYGKQRCVNIRHRDYPADLDLLHELNR